MPGLSGIEVAIMVRDRLPNCRILLLSGQAATADLLENARTRGYDFEILAKPIHPALLLERLLQLSKSRMGLQPALSSSKKEINNNHTENQAKAAATVVAHPRAHIVATTAENEN
jgi:DNA-binding NarL/FixJ family response regulator